MSGKPTEPDELRMPADKFDEMMRHALSAPRPVDTPPDTQPTRTNPRKAAKA